MLPMLDPQAHIPASSTVGSKFIRNHDPRRHGALLHQLAQQALSSFAIAAALDQDIQREAVLINSSPQPVPFSRNRDCDLTEVPPITQSRSVSAHAVGILAAELLPQRRMVSWLTSIPWAASISSTIRRLRGKRK
jgi:hypothetical protein